MNKYLENEWICKTTTDVLNHKFIINSLIDIVNKYSWDREYLSKKWEWSKDDIDFFNAFLVDIFRDANLYPDLEAHIQNKFKRFKSRFPHKIEDHHILAVLTTFDYIRTSINMLPITIEDTNRKLIDIINYDSYLWDKSTQIRREKLMRNNIPILDENGFEIVDYDETFDPMPIVSNYVLFNWFWMYSVKRKHIDKDYILMTYYWKVIRYKDEEVIPENLDTATYSIGNIYLQVDWLNTIIDQNWEDLIDSEWNQINEILWIWSLWWEEYLHVKSKKLNKNYYIKSSDKTPLYIDWDESKLVTILKDHNTKEWTYKAIDIKWKVYIIDNEWNEIENILSIASEQDLENEKVTDITPIQLVTD